MMTHPRDFDKAAATWDENPGRVKLAEDVARAITQQVVLTPEMDVLDFGCGTGLVTLRLAPLVRSITGVDTSQGMLDVLTGKALRQGLANVRTGHLNPGGAVAGSYDVIVSSMAFHHVEHTDAILRQLFQAIKTPGTLCVADLDLDQGEFHDDPTGVFHFGFDRAVLRGLFQDVGFSQISDVTAAEVAKPTRTGGLRRFSIFLMIGRRTRTEGS